MQDICMKGLDSNNLGLFLEASGWKMDIMRIYAHTTRNCEFLTLNITCFGGKHDNRRVHRLLQKEWLYQGDVTFGPGIVFITKEFEGEIVNDPEEVMEHKFFKHTELPDELNAFDSDIILEWAAGKA